MSRIGKKPIVLPPGVSFDVKEHVVSVQGPKGELSREIPREISLALVKGEVRCAPALETKKTPALWGLTRSLVANMIEGVTNGFEKKLEFEGIGYRMAAEGATLVVAGGVSPP